MLEIIVTILVAAIVVMIYWRYRSMFCLPFFWAAVFSFLYLGLLQLHYELGGSSYIYGAAGFGMFFLGLLAADFLFLYRNRTAKAKIKHQQSNRDKTEPDSNPKPDKQGKPTRIRLLFPTLPLMVGLFVSLIAATFVSFVFFAENGIPIFSSFPAMAWVMSTSGVVNRIMTVFGPSAYASLGLVAWAVHRQTGHGSAKALMYLGLGLAILSDMLMATKGAAIFVFIWFNILLFYMNKRRDFRKSLLPLIVVVVPLSAVVVAVRLMSSQGFFQAREIYETFYYRLTTIAAEPLDFIFKYMNRFGPMHGHALHMEVERIIAQLTGRTKMPILTEFVYDLMNRLPLTTTGLSASLTLEGTGYAEWGIAGLLLYSFVQGLGFGWIHRYLLRKETMSVITLVLWGAILNYVMAASGSGTILVSAETIFLDFVPPIVTLLPFCVFFLLPMARRYGGIIRRRAPTEVG